MSIELTCINCESLLSVDEIHAGKQLRCPTCNEINSIPVPLFEDENEFIPEIAPVEKPDIVERGQPDPTYVPPAYQGPKSAPVDPSQPWPESSGSRAPAAPSGPWPASGRGEFLPHGANQRASEKALGQSYLYLALGVMSYFLCGCLGVVIAPLLFGNGLTNASRVIGPGKTPAYTLNMIAFIVSLLIIGITIIYFVVI